MHPPGGVDLVKFHVGAVHRRHAHGGKDAAQVIDRADNHFVIAYALRLGQALRRQRNRARRTCGHQFIHVFLPLVTWSIAT